MQSNDRFLRSVDLPDIDPIPGWTGFLIKNLQSQRAGTLSLSGINDSQFYVSGILSSQYHAKVKQHPNGDLYIDGIEDKNAVLEFLRRLKKKQPQIEIMFADFTSKPKSPGIGGLIREGAKAIRDALLGL